MSDGLRLAISHASYPFASYQGRGFSPASDSRKWKRAVTAQLPQKPGPSREAAKDCSPGQMAPPFAPILPCVVCTLDLALKGRKILTQTSGKMSVVAASFFSRCLAAALDYFRACSAVSGGFT